MFDMVDKPVVINGKKRVFRVLPHPGSVCVIPWQNGKLALIRQFRPAIDAVIWEAPAGTMRHGEDPAECARRELTEETGLVSGNLVHLSSFYLAPGYSTEYMHLYLAANLAAGSRQLDEDETIEEPVWFSPSQAQKMIAEGIITDAKTIMAILLATAHPATR